MLNLELTPYRLDKDAEAAIVMSTAQLEERVALLRGLGRLNPETLKAYYGEKRFEQVAESNAIEGNTLNVGETQLAILKGVTFTGHDPAFSRDARALDKALLQAFEMAQQIQTATNIEQLSQLHFLILGDRPGSGVFRSEPVMLKGMSHIPPKGWADIMSHMERWQQWSQDNNGLAAPIRAVLLHAWLTHIHPYIDGNGRTARAITNLELVRAGYPPVIIRKKERARYIHALSESDKGDLRPFFDLVLGQCEDALTGLERSVEKKQGINLWQEKVRQRQQRVLQIWKNSIQLLIDTVEHFLLNDLETVNGIVQITCFEDALDLEDYLNLCEKKQVSKSWVFALTASVPGLPKIERLAYYGYRGSKLFQRLDQEGGPSLYWSVKNPKGYPPWNQASDETAPAYVEMTMKAGIGDEWYARKADDSIEQLGLTDLARNIARAVLRMVLDFGPD